MQDLLILQNLINQVSGQPNYQKDQKQLLGFGICMQMHMISMCIQETLRVAAKFIDSGMKVGLGTGSTVKHTVIELGRRVNEENLQIVGVPTSVATEKLALDVGIPLVELSQIEHLDIVIDGADEYDPNFQQKSIITKVKF